MQAVYYRAPDGSEPVDRFIEALGDPLDGWVGGP
jgi:hypothetical protein